jgi:Per1-like family
VYAAVAIAAWAASAAFHARDVKVTERTDYLLADALVLFGLLVAVARALGCACRRRCSMNCCLCHRSGDMHLARDCNAAVGWLLRVGVSNRQH